MSSLHTSVSSRLRTAILRDIEGYMISHITINGAVPNDILYSRLKAIPVHVYTTSSTDKQHSESWTASLNVHGPMRVMSSHIHSDHVSILYPNIHIIDIEDNEHIDVTLTITKGSGRNCCYYRPVEHVWIDTDGKLMIEPMRPHSVDDILSMAYKYI